MQLIATTTMQVMVMRAMATDETVTPPTSESDSAIRSFVAVRLATHPSCNDQSRLSNCFAEKRLF